MQRRTNLILCMYERHFWYPVWFMCGRTHSITNCWADDVHSLMQWSPLPASKWQHRAIWYHVVEATTLVASTDVHFLVHPARIPSDTYYLFVHYVLKLWRIQFHFNTEPRFVLVSEHITVIVEDMWVWSLIHCTNSLLLYCSLNTVTFCWWH